MSRLVSGLSFAHSVTKYEQLMVEWSMLAHSFSGWGLREIQGLTPRERTNWLEMAIHYNKVQRT